MPPPHPKETSLSLFRIEPSGPCLFRRVIRNEREINPLGPDKLHIAQQTNLESAASAAYAGQECNRWKLPQRTSRLAVSVSRTGSIAVSLSDVVMFLRYSVGGICPQNFRPPFYPRTALNPPERNRNTLGSQMLDRLIHSKSLEALMRFLHFNEHLIQLR